MKTPLSVLFVFVSLVASGCAMDAGEAEEDTEDTEGEVGRAAPRLAWQAFTGSCAIAGNPSPDGKGSSIHFDQNNAECTASGQVTIPAGWRATRLRVDLRNTTANEFDEAVEANLTAILDVNGKRAASVSQKVAYENTMRLVGDLSTLRFCKGVAVNVPVKLKATLSNAFIRQLNTTDFRVLGLSKCL